MSIHKQFLRPKQQRDTYKGFSVLKIHQTNIGKSLVFDFALLFDGVSIRRARDLKSLTNLILTPDGVIKVISLERCSVVIFHALAESGILYETIDDKPVVSVFGSSNSVLRIGINRGKKKVSLESTTPLFEGSTFETILKDFYLDDVKFPSVEGEILVDEEVETVVNMESCTREVKVWYTVINTLSKFFIKYGVRLRMTTASTGMEVFRTNGFTHKTPISPPGKTERKILKDHYHGARIADFGVVKAEGDIVLIDINGHYPTECKQPLPIGVPYLSKPSIEEILTSDELSFVYCKLRLIKKDNIGIVPIRNTKLEFPTVGEYTDWFTSLELKLVYEEGKGEILEVYKALMWKESFYLLRLFSNLTGYMMQDTTYPGVRKFIKNMRTFLYAKFAQKESIQTTFFGPIPEAYKDKVILVDEMDEDTGEISEGWVLEEDSPTTHQMPQISLFVAAYARIKTYKAMMNLISLGFTLLHTNNDSIILIGEPPASMIGDKDGEWKIAKRAKGIIILSPECYCMYSDEDSIKSIGPGFETDQIPVRDFRKALLGHPNIIRGEIRIIKTKGFEVEEVPVLRSLRHAHKSEP